MKKIYINETSLGNIKEYGLLPKFLFKMVKGHKTSLGDNAAFPKVGEYPFDYSVIKKRFEDVSFHIKSTLNEFDEDSLMSELSSLVTECKSLEEPIKDSLEKLAENSINRLFAIPEGTINFTFKLVGTVSFKNSPRITPESDEDIKFSFKDIADIDHSNKAVEKRRFINALIQGGSRRMLETALSSDEVAYADLGKLNPHLITLYKKILYINDYLLFTKPEKLDDKKPMQGSYVETHLGSDGNRSTIDAQGIIFPLLLQEAIKGIFELFSSHGLPSDRNKAMYVIKKADYILAEPWDMRFGPTLWDMIFGGIEDSNIVPYAFTNLIKLSTDEFNSSVREILAGTETGEKIIGDIINAAQYDSDYQEFTNRINARNIDKAVIADSYFSAAELDGLDIDSEESNVIEESEDGDVDYMKLIENATVDNIDFEESRIISGRGEELILTIKGVKIPQLLVSLVVYLVKIEVEGKPARVLNLHIILDRAIQGLGLGTKIYTKMVYEFGSLYSWKEWRTNDEHIGKIFKRLSADPKIEVTTIPGKKGGLDYLAVLKGHNIFESIKKDKELIAEGWSKDKKRIVDRCVKIIKAGNETFSTAKAYDIEEKIANKYFHGEMASSLKIRKYEPMITKILVQELGYPDCPTTTKEQKFLQSVVKCIWNYEVRQGKTPMAVGSFEGNGPDNFETLVAKYKPLIDEIKNSGRNLDGNPLGESDYEIIHIPDFETAGEWGKYSWPKLPLCFTTHDYQWENFTNNDKNKCFLCLNKKTWKNWGVGEEPETFTDETPYDEYGLSMIWVFINPEGEIAYSNTRWNHNMEDRIPDMPYGGIDVDESFSKDGLEDVLGMPFEDAFKIESFCKSLNDEVNEKLEKINQTGNISDFDRLFGDKNIWSCSYFKSNDLIKIINYKEDKVNLLKKVNGKWEIAFPDTWFDNLTPEYWSDNRIIAGVRIYYNDDSFYNLINSNLEFVLPNNLWCDRITLFETNICGEKVTGYLLEKDGLENIFVPGKGMVFDRFVAKTGGANQVLMFTLNADGSITAYPPDGGSPVSLEEVLEQYIASGRQTELPPYIANNFMFDGNRVFCDLFGRKSNIFDEKTGKFLFNFWVESIEDLENGFKKINYDSVSNVNILKPNGELLIDKPPLEWPFDIVVHFDRYFVIEGQEDTSKHNICGLDGKFLFDINDENSWPTDVTIRDANLIEGQRFIVFLADYLNDKYNLADENLNILWKGKWFDGLKFRAGYNTGMFVVKIGEKHNYFSTQKMGLLYEGPYEDWFEYAMPFINGAALLACVTKEYKNYNFIDINGELLFEDSYITNIDNYERDGVYIVRNSNDQYNIVDLEKGNIISDEWFERVDFCEEKMFKCQINNKVFFYNSESGEFVENTSKNSLHDFSDYNENLDEYLKTVGFDEVRCFKPGELYRVKDMFIDEAKYNLVGVVNGRPQFLLPQWCSRVGMPHGIGIKCKDGDNQNIFNLSTLQYMFEEPLYLVEWDEDCFMVYMNSRTVNFVNTNCELLLDKWPTDIDFEMVDEDGNDVYKVRFEDNMVNLYCPARKGFLLDKNYKIVDALGTKLIKVGKWDGYDWFYNLVVNGSDLVLDKWANEIYPCETNGFISLDYSGANGYDTFNIYNLKTGEFISDEPIYVTCPIQDNPFHFKVVKNGKVNFLKNLDYVEYTLPDWADSVTEFYYGEYALAMINGKEYTLMSEPKKGQYIVEGDIYGLNSEKINNLKQSLVQAIKNSSDFDNGEEYFNGDAFIEGGDAEFVGSINGIKLYRLGYHLRRDGVPEFYGYRDDDSGEYVDLDINPNDISEIIRLIH